MTTLYVITVAEWFARPPELRDAPAYWHEPGAQTVGQDPWRTIEDVEPPTDDGVYTVLFVAKGWREVPGYRHIYISPAEFHTLKRAEQCGS